MDKEQDRIQKEYKCKPGFDDSHIVAIVIVAKTCKVICSHDNKRPGKKSSIFYLDEKYYPKNIKVPSLYSNEKHKHLLYKTKECHICNSR